MGVCYSKKSLWVASQVKAWEKGHRFIKKICKLRSVAYNETLCLTQAEIGNLGARPVRVGVTRSHRKAGPKVRLWVAVVWR